MFVFYILYSSERDRFYVGFTADSMEERSRKHNSNHKGFTGGVGDWQVVFSENYPEKATAMAREREVKSWKSRKRIEGLISKAG